MLRDFLIKQLKNAVITTEPVKMPVKSTGILSLDVISGGGYAEGMITHIWGREGGGKTTTAMLFALSRQKLGKEGVYFDLEHKLDASKYQDLGVDFSLCNVVRSKPDAPMTGNYVADACEMLVGQADYIIIDSAPHMVPAVVFDSKTGDAQFAKGAALMTRWFQTFVPKLATTNTAVILINQARANVSGYGAPYLPWGGYALQHNVPLRLRLRSASRKTDIAHVSVTNEKLSYNGSPYGETEFTFSFKTGLDAAEDVFNAAKAAGALTFSGTYYLEGEKLGMRGAKDVMQELRDNSEFLQTVRAATLRVAKLVDAELVQQVDDSSTGPELIES